MKTKVFACVLFVIVALTAYFIRPTLWKDLVVMPFHRDEKTITVALKTGQPLSGFARALQEQGIVADARCFLYHLRKKGVDRTLRAGAYRLASGPSWYVADQLANACPEWHSVAIIPGADPRRPFPFGTAEEQRAALAATSNYPEALRSILPDTPEARAAFLLPDTYYLTEKSLPELISQASGAWYRALGQKVTDPAAALRGAVIASLVQRETALDDEYAVIAGVIENRLAKNMLLQIDASVVYAWRVEKGENLTRVLYKHLEIDSPWNTYKYGGLPPGPICVPSAAAWNGALSPKKIPYYYYVAEGDRHIFAKTLQEHENNVRRVRRPQNQNSPAQKSRLKTSKTRRR